MNNIEENKRKLITIDPITVAVECAPSVKNVYSIFSAFPHSPKKKADVRFIIAKSAKRDSLFTDKSFSIFGPDIDNINDPYNTIGILQAFFRFIGLHSLDKGSILLHASAAYFQKTPIIFGDDGKSQGKSISSMISVIASKSRYIGDEFCFFDFRQKSITGFPSVPIHIRPIVETYLRKVFRFHLNKGLVFSESSSGKFILPKRYFRVSSSAVKPIMVFVHYSKGNERFMRLRGVQKHQAVAACITAHLIKLVYPEYDRMNFAERSDSTKTKTINLATIKRFVTAYRLKRSIQNVVQSVECYKIFINEPESLIDQLRLLV